MQMKTVGVFISSLRTFLREFSFYHVLCCMPFSVVCACSVASNSCDPMNYSPPGSSVPGILPARILEGLPVPSPGDLPDPGIEPMSPAAPALAGGFFTTW